MCKIRERGENMEDGENNVNRNTAKIKGREEAY
jgi:hypothetical protein